MIVIVTIILVEPFMVHFVVVVAMAVVGEGATKQERLGNPIPTASAWLNSISDLEVLLTIHV